MPLAAHAFLRVIVLACAARLDHQPAGRLRRRSSAVQDMPQVERRAQLRAAAHVRLQGGVPLRRAEALHGKQHGTAEISRLERPEPNRNVLRPLRGVLHPFLATT